LVSRLIVAILLDIRVLSLIQLGITILGFGDIGCQL
jgi:hypothetical protein